MNEQFGVSAVELHQFCAALLDAHGVEGSQAETVAGNIVWNELVARKNFGFLRLPLYVERLNAGGLNGRCKPHFQSCGDAVGLLDGDEGFGQYTAHVGMTYAIEMARSQGVGVVATRNSNFFGTGAYFVNQACESGMIGLAASNSFPKVTAHGGRTPVFGTNPFAFGAPERDGNNLLVDLSTSALAGSTVREHIKQDTPLPTGLAIDANGRPITDPRDVSNGALLPFAGAKGYCLSFMVEMLCGVLTGAGISKDVASMYESVSESGDNGHFILALDPARFMDIDMYYDRLDGLIGMVRASAAPSGEVLIPGEIRWKHYRENLENGVALDEGVRGDLERISKLVGVKVPWH